MHRIRGRRAALKTSEKANTFADLKAGLTGAAIVMTRHGEVPAEWLETGDEVLTRGHGYQPITHISRVKLDRVDLRAHPEMTPVVIPAGRLDGRFPERDVMVSPQQLVLLHATAEHQRDVFVPASALGRARPQTALKRETRVIYVQIQTQLHCALMADGLWQGSVFTGDLETGIVFSKSSLQQRLRRVPMAPASPILSGEAAAHFVAEMDASTHGRVETTDKSVA